MDREEECLPYATPDLRSDISKGGSWREYSVDCRAKAIYPGYIWNVDGMEEKQKA